MWALHALRPEASADDGKRRTAVLEVDVSPLRANKEGNLREGRAQDGSEGWEIGGFLEASGRFPL